MTDCCGFYLDVVGIQMGYEMVSKDELRYLNDFQIRIEISGDTEAIWTVSTVY